MVFVFGKQCLHFRKHVKGVITTGIADAQR